MSLKGLLLGSVLIAACAPRDSTRPLTPTDLTQWNEITVEKAQAAFTSGRLSATLLVRIYHKRIELLDPALKATLSLNPEALADAAALDRALARSGKLVGPLHGVPVILKDN